MESAIVRPVLNGRNSGPHSTEHRILFETHVQRLVTAMDATPEVFVLTDSECRLSFVNPAFQVATGYGIEAVLGRTDEFLRAGSEREKVAQYREAVRAGREWIGELINQRADGSLYHVEATISPISDMEGRFIGYVGCERDISLRKELEMELRREHGFVRSILQSLNTAIYALDEKFCLTHANEGWRRLAGEHAGIRLEAAPQIGKCLLDYVPDALRRAELQFIFRSVIASGQAEEHAFASADGKHWLVRVSPWVFEDRVRGLICSVADQTRQLQLQNQLFQSQKMEIIGALAAGVAHDFNNLLQVIRGNNGLMLFGLPADSPLRRFADQINMATFRAAEITKQLLSFSRESTEKRAVLDLNQVIQEVSHLVRRTLRSNISVELKPECAAVPVKADSTRLNQALLNLCLNAQDAMPRGGKLVIANSLEVLTGALAQRHGHREGAQFACCRVTDTGCGIPAEVLARIFEPFFTTKEKGKGTGLGLPIVHRVVQEAGGFVEVSSESGQGTTFMLYFPIAREAVTPPPPISDQPLKHGIGRVLIVEDMDLLRDFNRTFLQEAGLTVFVAAGAREAIECLERERQPMDILFTDYSMPEMNGIQLIEHVSERWPKVKLMLASGYLDESARQRLAELNVNILAKPYEMQQAADMIIRLLPK